MIHVRVLPFGMLKDWLGSSSATVELPDGSTVAGLLRQLGEGRRAEFLTGIAVSVNAEFTQAAHVLLDGDEVGLLPPVSGGAPDSSGGSGQGTGSPSMVTALTREPIQSERLIAQAKQGEDGAVVVFDGIVRNNTRGRQTLYLDYESYEEMASTKMSHIAQEAKKRFGVCQVTIVHRLGRLQVGETSVLIVVASAHRAAAYEASRWLIDTLKTTVPIWKKETFVDGAVWAAGEPFPEGISVEAGHDL